MKYRYSTYIFIWINLLIINDMDEFISWDYVFGDGRFS